MSSDAYPLSWPEGWPRTPSRQKVDGRGLFQMVADDGWKRPYTFARARDALLDELGRISPRGAVISTNFPLSRGVAIESKRRPEDEGVALYFMRGGKPYAMACDRYTRAEENMNSLRKAIEALRQLERHGGGVMLERAFQGFVALPQPKRWWEILGVAPTASAAEVESAYRALARAAHPDTGGSTARMAELNSAREAARDHLVAKLTGAP